MLELIKKDWKKWIV